MNQVLKHFELSTLKAKAVKGGGINIVSTMISFLVQTVGVIALGRLLKPSDFGVVAMVSAFYLLLMNFGPNGFTEYIIQKKSVETKDLNSIFWIHAAMSLSLTLGLVAAGPILSRFYEEPAIRLITQVMAAGIMVQMLSTVHQSILKRDMEFRKLAINNILASVLSTTLAIVLAIKGFGHWAVVSRQLSTVVFVTLGSWIVCPWRPNVPGGFRNGKNSIRFALRVYGNFALGYFAKSLDKVLLGRFHGPILLGYYDRAYHLSSMPVEQLASPLHSVGLATLSRLSNNRARYEKYYKKALQTLSFFGLFASVVMTVSGGDLIRIILGAEWQQAGYIVRAFGPGIGVNILYWTHSWIHLSLGRPDRWLRWSAFSLLFTAVLLFLASRISPIHVAAAYSFSYYVLLVPSIWYAGKPIQLRIGPLIKALRPYFLSGLCTCVLELVLLELWKGTALHLQQLRPLLRVGVVCTGGGVVYMGLLVAFRRSLDPIREVLSALKIFLARNQN